MSDPRRQQSGRTLANGKVAMEQLGPGPSGRPSSPSNAISTSRIRRALAAVLAGRAATTLTGEEFEKAVEIAGACQPLLTGQLRQAGFVDRWNEKVGFSAKTILVSNRTLRDAIFEQPGPIAPPVEVEIGELNLPVMKIPRWYSRDKGAEANPELLEHQQLSGATLAGRYLVENLNNKAKNSIAEHDVAEAVWSFGLRHPDGARFAYAELPYAALDAETMNWAWIEVPSEDGSELEPIALEGETANGWKIRWFLRGGQVRGRFQLDENRISVFRLSRKAA